MEAFTNRYRNHYQFLKKFEKPENPLHRIISIDFKTIIKKWMETKASSTLAQRTFEELKIVMLDLGRRFFPEESTDKLLSDQSELALNISEIKEIPVRKEA